MKRGSKKNKLKTNEAKKSFLDSVEHFNARLIPLALILLLGIIIVELFVHIESVTLTTAVHVADYIVVTIFVIDLIFLAQHSRNARFFFRHYWLDILAVFPFSIFFSLVGSIYKTVAVAETVSLSQGVFHESLEVSREAKVLAQSGSRVGKGIRIAARSLRIVTKSRLFTKVHTRRYGLLDKDGKTQQESKTRKKKR